MRGWTRAAVTVVAAAALTWTGGGSALAAEFADGWEAPNGGVTVSEDGVVTLDDNGTTGVSYENQDLDIAVANGDAISFEYKGDCGGGAPRVFIQGGAFNTFDQDPNGAACGTAIGDGWFEVTATIDGVTGATAGHTGIVNDSLDGRVVEVRDLVIAGEQVELVADGGGEPGPRKQNHGQCVSSAEKGGEARSTAAKSDCGKPDQAQKGAAKGKKGA